MGTEKRQEAYTFLLKLSENQGYITIEDVMNVSDEYSLEINDVDWLTNALTVRGIIIYDEVPSKTSSAILSSESDEYLEFDDYSQIDYEKIYDRVIALNESLEPFINEVRTILPPQRGEVDQLKYLALEGNKHARNRMIEMHIRHAVRIALSRAERYDLDIVDTIGEACFGLIKAIDKYNPDLNGKFPTYSSMWILQNLTRTQDVKGRDMYYPIHVKELYLQSYLELKENGIWSDDDFLNNDNANKMLMEKFGYTYEKAGEILKMMVPFESFDVLMESWCEDDNSAENIDINEDIVIPDDLIYNTDIDEKLMNEEVRNYLDVLDEREKNIIELRYGFVDNDPKTLEEIGDIFGLTRERIRQLESKGLKKLKRYLK